MEIMASGPITWLQRDGETMEIVTDFIFWGSKITVDSDCSHEIKRHLLLGRKTVVNLESVLKSRDITLLIKVCIVKAMVFPGVMYGCERWTKNKAEHWRINAFELWCWRRLFRVPWTARRTNPLILKETQHWICIRRTDAEAEAPIFGHLMQRTDSWKRPWHSERLRAGEEDSRGWDGWRVSSAQLTWVWANSKL